VDRGGAIGVAREDHGATEKSIGQLLHVQNGLFWVLISLGDIAGFVYSFCIVNCR
jgi:hypothetical protein